MHSGRYWMDNLYCDGTENDLTTCRFDGWGQNDCDSGEAAGVVCQQLDDQQQQDDNDHDDAKNIHLQQPVL